MSSPTRRARRSNRPSRPGHTGAYRNEDNDSYWVDDDTHGRIGFVRFEELGDGAPLFDLRLATDHRGRSRSAAVLRAAADYVFTTMPAVRFEGQTREDNVPMRRTFLRCGWVKEAHYREAWPTATGVALASVGYGLLRRDWASGRPTPLVWDDLPG